MDGRTGGGGAAPHVASGCVLGGVVGAVAGMVVLRQVLVSWSECEVGVNSGANLLFLAIFVWPPLTLLNAVVFTVAFAVAAGRWNRQVAFVTALVAVVLLGVVSGIVLTPLLTPDDYPLTCG